MIYSWILLSWISIVESEINLYDTDQSRNTVLYHDCLHYTANNPLILTGGLSPLEAPFQTISYCRRLADDEINDSEINEGPSSSFRFNELKSRNVTALDLTKWSIPFDLIENYQDYLETANLALAEHIVKKCSWGHFGTYCQYVVNTDCVFSAFVDTVFTKKRSEAERKPYSLSSPGPVCYTQLNCGRCLDWREVCDGKVDCPNEALDEQNCLILEMNECADNEYRCHHGMCIPESFLDSYSFSPECLDINEKQLYKYREHRANGFVQCPFDPTFKCEESHHLQHLLNYPCGDGETISLFHPNPCMNRREDLYLKTLVSLAQNTHLSSECWLELSCAVNIQDPGMNQCSKFCHLRRCTYNLQNMCPSPIVFFPQHVILHDHIRFAYLTNRTIQRRQAESMLVPDYVCYKAARCPFLISNLHINGSACVRTEELGIKAVFEIERVFRTCSIDYRQSNLAGFRSESLFQCPNSTKIISKHRLVDGVRDCYDGVDEYSVSGCALNQKDRFRCQSENRCISRIALYNRISDCSKGEDEVYVQKISLSFQAVCNGFTNIKPELIDGQNETDETNCEEWPCDNIYTRCDRAWSCLNGSDESKCNWNRCPFDTSLCISPSNLTSICLPMSRTNDGIIDCLGATDERSYCRRSFGDTGRLYRCRNQSECIWTDDICQSRQCAFENMQSQCQNDHFLTMVDNLHEDDGLNTKPKREFFSIGEISTLPKLVRLTRQSSESIKLSVCKTKLDAWICNRGVPIDVQAETKYHCFCPPSYYGNRCQFQSQRVSLTLQLQKICVLNCVAVFEVLITLVDNEETIHSQEHITYVPTLHCHRKFNIYLLYNQRNKSLEKTYSIRIDIYNRVDLSYYSSWIFPIQFIFLPVNRVLALLTLPLVPMTSSCSKACAYGHCFLYVNTREEFCLCKPGWTGEHCTTPVNCSCSPDSLCLGVVHNRSTCLCSLHKSGPRCYLRSICQSKPCFEEESICIPNGNQNTRTCLTKNSFLDKESSFRATFRLEISFSHIVIPQFVWIHLIHVEGDSPPERKSIPAKIKLNQDEAIVHYSGVGFDFHLLFVQIQQQYYLALVHRKEVILPTTRTNVRPSHRCPSIEELIGTRLSAYPLLRRIKYYHRVCRQQPKLSCFHDREMFMCMCTAERHANCFHFDFDPNYQHEELHGCQNGAQSLRDKECPTWLICICPDCFYGSKCQFTSKGASLSLEVILGYSVRGHASLSRQLVPVKISIALTILMFIVGLINGFTSAMTFRIKALRETGCGCYLFASSMVSLFIAITFSFKVMFLLLAQMSIIVNDSFLYVNCVLIDYLLRSLLAIVDWLNASIAIERAFVVIRGANFNKKRSHQVAQLVTFLIIILVFGSMVHDPIHRQLVTDEEDERTWCIVKYHTFHLNFLNSAVNVVHSVVPFSINLAMAFVIIMIATRQRASAQKQLSYIEHLREQWRCHSHLIISPIVLILLAIPRLIISFFFRCMKSARNPGLFLAGYFISFIPPLLTYFIYILPSKTYKKEFHTLLMQCRLALSRMLCIKQTAAQA